MRYHYEKPDIYISYYGETYKCDHPVYNTCTLFKIGERGLAVIQQRFSKYSKVTWWIEIDGYLNDAIYLNPGFKDYFNARAKKPQNGLYQTVTVRQIMWALKMKPLPKERWDTTFDRRDI